MHGCSNTTWLAVEASGTATVTLDGLGNTIDDAEFFPDLPGLVNGVADRLTRLMDLDKRLISALHKVHPVYHVATLVLSLPNTAGCMTAMDPRLPLKAYDKFIAQ